MIGYLYLYIYILHVHIHRISQKNIEYMYRIKRLAYAHMMIIANHMIIYVETQRSLVGL